MGLIGRGRYFEATRMMSLRDIKIGELKGYKDDVPTGHKDR